jgi:hypothetical protein
MYKKIKELTLMALPLSLSSAAIWGVVRAYYSYWIAELGDAQLAALLIWAGAHLLMPVWAAARQKWGLAILMQAPLLFVHYVAFLFAIFAPEHGVEYPHHPGFGGAVIAIGLLISYFGYLPIAFFAAMFGRRWIGGSDVNEDGALVLNPRSDGNE